MHFSPHVAELGHHQRIVGTVMPGCGWPKDNSFSWTDLYAGLEPVKGCKPNEVTCTLKPTSGTGTYQVGCITGANGQGDWTSCDYYGVLGKNCFQLTGRVTSQGQGQGGVRVYAEGLEARGSAVTDPSGHYAIILCHRGDYIVYADDAVIFHHIAGTYALESYAFASFTPASGDCHATLGPTAHTCVVSMHGDRAVEFRASHITAYVSPQPQGESAGSHIFSQTEKQNLLNLADQLSVVSTVTGGVGVLAAVAPEPVISKGSAAVLGLTSLLTQAGSASISFTVNIVDPFDPGYKAVAAPAVTKLPRLPYGKGRQAALLRRLARAVIDEQSLAQALAVTMNRFSSAAQAGDTRAAATQRRAAAQYLNRIAALIKSQIGLQRRLAALLRRAHGGKRLVRLRVVRRLGDLTPRDALAQRLSSLGVYPGTALAWANKVAAARVPRRVDVTGGIAAPKSIRLEQRAVAIFRAVAKRL